MLAIAVKNHYNLINFLQNNHDIYPPRELWVYFVTRSRHQMETFSALRDICAGNSLVIWNFPAQRPVIRSFDVFFDLHLIKWLSKQSWGWWLEMPSHSLWCHSNEFTWCHKGPVIVRRAGLLWSQQDFEWRRSVPLFKCLTVLEFSFILFNLCLLITFFIFIMNYVPIVTFWIFTYHKIWILSIMFCSIWSYWIIYFLACLEVSWRVVS